MDEYCVYDDSHCKYLEICKQYIEGEACIKDLLGTDLVLLPQYSPEAILKRIKKNRNKPVLK